MSVALITGAASGLGKEFAKLYAKENDVLVLVDKNENGLNVLKEELLKNNSNLKVHLLIKDLTNIAEVKSVYEYTTSLNLKVTNKTYSLIKSTKDLILESDKVNELITLSISVLKIIDNYYWSNLDLDFENEYFKHGFNV